MQKKKKTANNKTQTYHKANGIMTICNHPVVLLRVAPIHSSLEEC